MGVSPMRFRSHSAFEDAWARRPCHVQMPESPQDKIRPTPEPPPERFAPSPYAYAELDITTNFTFLTGASHADELVLQTARLGHRAIAVTDTNTLAGAVRMHDAV